MMKGPRKSQSPNRQRKQPSFQNENTLAKVRNASSASPIRASGRIDTLCSRTPRCPGHGVPSPGPGTPLSEDSLFPGRRPEPGSSRFGDGRTFLRTSIKAVGPIGYGISLKAPATAVAEEKNSRRRSRSPEVIKHRTLQPDLLHRYGMDGAESWESGSLATVHSVAEEPQPKVDFGSMTIASPQLEVQQLRTPTKTVPRLTLPERPSMRVLVGASASRPAASAIWHDPKAAQDVEVDAPVSLQRQPVREQVPHYGQCVLPSHLQAFLGQGGDNKEILLPTDLAQPLDQITEARPASPRPRSGEQSPGSVPTAELGSPVMSEPSGQQPNAIPESSELCEHDGAPDSPVPTQLQAPSPTLIVRGKVPSPVSSPRGQTASAKVVSPRGRSSSPIDSPRVPDASPQVVVPPVKTSSPVSSPPVPSSSSLKLGPPQLSSIPRAGTPGRPLGSPRMTFQASVTSTSASHGSQGQEDTLQATPTSPSSTTPPVPPLSPRMVTHQSSLEQSVKLHTHVINGLPLQKVTTSPGGYQVLPSSGVSSGRHEGGSPVRAHHAWVAEQHMRRNVGSPQRRPSYISDGGQWNAQAGPPISPSAQGSRSLFVQPGYPSPFTSISSAIGFKPVPPQGTMSPPTPTSPRVSMLFTPATVPANLSPRRYA